MRQFLRDLALACAPAAVGAIAELARDALAHRREERDRSRERWERLIEEARAERAEGGPR